MEAMVATVDGYVLLMSMIALEMLYDCIDIDLLVIKSNANDTNDLSCGRSVGRGRLGAGPRS